MSSILGMQNKCQSDWQDSYQALPGSPSMRQVLAASLAALVANRKVLRCRD
jgi:hypothetical protein